MIAQGGIGQDRFFDAWVKVNKQGKTDMEIDLWVK
jgi:hypothetical protein